MQIIWTKHLKERIEQRGLSPSLVDKAVRFPDEIVKSNTTDSNKHIKTIGGYKIVAAVKRQGSDWIITSAWWNYANQGSSHYQTSNKLFFERWIESFIRWIEKKITGR